MNKHIIFITNHHELDSYLAEQQNNFNQEEPDIILAGHEVSPCYYTTQKVTNNTTPHEFIPQPTRYVNNPFNLPFGGQFLQTIQKDIATHIVTNQLSKRTYLAQDAIIQNVGHKIFTTHKCEIKAVVSVFLTSTGLVYLNLLVFAKGNLTVSESRQSQRTGLQNDIAFILTTLATKYHVQHVYFCGNLQDPPFDISHHESISWCGTKPFAKLRRNPLNLSIARQRTSLIKPLILSTLPLLVFGAVIYHQNEQYLISQEDYQNYRNGIEDLLASGASTSISLIQTTQYYMEHTDRQKNGDGIHLLLGAVSALKTKHSDIEPTLLSLSFAKTDGLSFNNKSFNFALLIELTMTDTTTQNELIDTALKEIGGQANVSLELVNRPKTTKDQQKQRLILHLAGNFKGHQNEN
jgi:hypothetical protein